MHPSRRKFLQTLSFGLGTALTASAITSIKKQSGSVDKKLGIALVGLGSYAKNQLAVALEKTDDCYLAGIVTGTPAKAEEWSRKYNIPQKIFTTTRILMRSQTTKTLILYTWSSPIPCTMNMFCALQKPANM
jgi:hypothetical protein